MYDIAYRVQDQLVAVTEFAVDFLLPFLALVTLALVVTAGIVVVG